MNILITGANGFVGQAVCQRILAQYPEIGSIYAVCRRPSLPQSLLDQPQIQPVIVQSLAELAASTQLLSQVDCIIHLAARVHQMNDQSADPLAEFRAVNTAAPCQLAQAAARAGVRRFIYLSSIKVHGEASSAVEAYAESDQLRPSDPYGISKWEAEVQLQQIALQTGLEVVILRPPLVYGPMVKANFLQMLRVVQRRIPLPLGAVQNRRSLVYVGNLADAIIVSAQHPAAANQTFLVSDGEDLSTPQLLRRIARSFNQSPRLLSLPVGLLQLIARLTGKSAAVSRLIGSLVVDSHKIQQTLAWQPPYTVDQGLQATVDWLKAKA
ncbi:SDR family oxidoreductase [filamentous cyanobacterium LEGE 11480]|uniref:SDR family oxidoreductase n=1 Tax=Romeriopsis navalis LEGE 11480 TaxID=2777977 RepID=A0A928VN39_9CYAN|nr:SDR family oxidoreductase [Romeriopsis navalis]MBE9028899.1 SDR family oxidoreductase [Romeriopsis navalis LEGE 11480]